MNPDLHRTITQRLLADYEFREQGEWFRRGRCPQCSKRELYTRADAPWVLRCGRLNHCGWTAHVKELYPEIFASWSDRYRTTEADPNAAAVAYLRYARGLDATRWASAFEQGQYYDPELRIGSATVRFPLASGGWWERLIDRPERFGKKKAVFKAGTRYQGHWWVPPGLDVTAGDEIWIVEGIFNALALVENGIPAVAALTSNNYPDKALQELREQLGARRPRFTLVWALDSDAAGMAFTAKWVERALDDDWNCAAAQIPQRGNKKVDWNDLHQRGQLGVQDIERYRYQGDLLLAEDPSSKALLMYKHLNRREFWFEFRRRTYWFKLDLEKYNKARENLQDARDVEADDDLRNQAIAESGTVTEIANCLPTALHFQANEVTDESWYYLRIDFPHDGPSVKAAFTGGQIASVAEFKKRLVGMAPGAWFTGSGAQLDRILKEQTYNIRKVETIDYVGYSREHGCYVYNHLAVNDGKVHQLNAEDFFEVGKLSIKTLSQSVPLAVNTDLSEYDGRWIGPLVGAFGAKGIVALSFWFGSLFAEQIRAAQKSFPFLEVVGEAGAGKTTLIEFLWKLLGRRDYEGFDPSKATLPARARNFAQVSGMPVVLIEADREQDTAKGGKFDWEELKTAYNGRSVRARGAKTGGNETYEPPFRGSIVIAQNAPVNASDAIMQRICHLYFDRAAQTPATRQFAEQLENWPMDTLSGFLVKALQSERATLDVVERMSPQYARDIQTSTLVRVPRIAKNHGLLMALTDALAAVVGLNQEQVTSAHELLRAMAVERQRAINADHPIVADFWEAYDYLNSMGGEDALNHSRDPGVIAVNLNHFMERAAAHRQQVPPMVDLKRHLKSSRSRRYVEQKPVNSVLWSDMAVSKAVRCWIFDVPKARHHSA